MTDDGLVGDGGRSRKGGRRALGRGLDALLPAVESGAVQEVEIDRIEPNPDQPRKRFGKETLEELAQSIKEHGVVQPLVVAARGDGRYGLIVGERRWQASKLAGLQRVPVVVREASPRETLELALVENVQRADLDPLEEAAAYGRLIQDFGLTQADVALRVGKSRVAVTNTLRLTALPEAAKRALIEGRITEGHGRALLGLTDVGMQLAVLDRVEGEGLTVRQTEELVRRLSGQVPVSEPAPSPERNADTEAVEAALRRALGAKVSVQRRKRGGRIVIEYFSDDEFEGLYGLLVGETQQYS